MCQKEDPITFVRSSRYPHLFHFCQIGRIKIVEKQEAIAGDVLGRARHNATKITPTATSTRETEGKSFMQHCQPSCL